VEVGDVAHYFNAQAGHEMIVVSWTGDEIEFYRGMDLPRGAMASAFGLASDMPAGWPGSGDAGAGSSAAGWVIMVIGLIAIVGFVTWFKSPNKPPRLPALLKVKATAPRLIVGGQGALDRKTWQIHGRALVDIAEVGSLWERHEYALSDENGNQALLVFGGPSGKSLWTLFESHKLTTPMSPHQAAAIRIGETVTFGDASGRVNALFQSTNPRRGKRKAPISRNQTAGR